MKICGITTPDDAVATADAGADAIGLNFTPWSRRRIDVPTAQAILDVLPDHVLAVGIFRDHLPHEVLDVARELGLVAVQLHGSETPQVSRTVHQSIPVLVRALSATDPALAEIDDHGADVVLLDAPVPGGGEPFDWSLVGDLTRRHPVLLAGGLRPDNVAEAISTVRPWGVDVASGVESDFGHKDPDAVRRFIDTAREAFGRFPSDHPPLQHSGTTA